MVLDTVVVSLSLKKKTPAFIVEDTEVVIDLLTSLVYDTDVES